MKPRVAALFALFLMAALFFTIARRDAGSAQTAQSGRTAVLIRFGLDGRPDADWSGAVSPTPAGLEGWQFDSADQVSGSAWKCATRRERYWDTPYEASMGPTSTRDKVTVKGIVAEFDVAYRGEVRISTPHGPFSFRLDSLTWDGPRAFLDGRVDVTLVPLVARLSSGPQAEDYPSLFQAAGGDLWMAYSTFDNDGDRIFVQRRAGGVWSKPVPLSPPGGDCFRTAISQDRSGRIWVVWAAQAESNFDLYGRAFDGATWSPAERLTTASASDIYHALARDREGNLYLAYQSARSGNFDIFLRTYDGQRWSGEIQVSSDPADDWEPALAVAPGGKVTILWDTYSKGNYDVVARDFARGKLGDLVPIASSGALESRVSAQYDAQGRLWIAWDEGDWNWGKDYGNRIPESGRGLLVRRQARVAVLSGGKLLEPAQSVSEAIPADLRQVFHQPKLVLDAQSTPWVFFRYRVNLPQTKASGASRALWRLGATSYRKDRWLPLVEFPGGYGRMDAPVSVVAARDRGLELAWSSDGRQWPSGVIGEQDLFFAGIPSAGSRVAPALTAFRPNTEALPVSHAGEDGDVARVRAYRAEVGGRTFRIARGDLHRHTDLSWDGNRDGSLDDAYRYALDAAAFDYLGVCDHQGGGSIPYHWWMIQKAADLFAIPGRFAPIYSYERSLTFPNGHRNVFFARRGRPIFDPSPAEERGEEGAARLYQYLRRFGGLTSSHTSATGAGTDWRDSDPELEPVVEIYQGYRNSYESPDGPRHPSARQSEKFAAGFVWNAWAKGIKMGVQSSSDHVSTHISYASLYVDRLDRQGILEALKARRTYAATDNLVIDFRMGGRFMGASFDAPAAPLLEARVAGTAPIARVEVVKSNRIVYTAPAASSELSFTFTDAAVAPGEAWYYLRVLQSDGQIGWSSPIWVRYSR